MRKHQKREIVEAYSMLSGEFGTCVSTRTLSLSKVKIEFSSDAFWPLCRSVRWGMPRSVMCTLPDGPFHLYVLIFFFMFGLSSLPLVPLLFLGTASGGTSRGIGGSLVCAHLFWLCFLCLPWVFFLYCLCAVQGTPTFAPNSSPCSVVDSILRAAFY